MTDEFARGSSGQEDLTDYGHGGRRNEIPSWLAATVRAVTTGPLILFRSDELCGPACRLVVDPSESPTPRTVGDLLALPTGRWFGEQYRDRFVAEFGEEGLDAVDLGAPVDRPDKWMRAAIGGR